MEESFELVDVFCPGEYRGAPTFYRAAPGIVVTPAGTVLAVIQERVGTVGDSFNNKNVVLRRSFDHGKTWEPIQRLLASERHAHATGCILVDEQVGRVLLFVKREPVEDAVTGHDEAWMIEHPEVVLATQGRQLVIYSDDEGETWSEPIDVSRSLVYHSRFSTKGSRLFSSGDVRMPVSSGGSPGIGVQLKHGPHSGRLVATARLFSKPVWDINAYAHNAVVLSDDHGLTWRLGGLAQPGTGECDVVELADGAVYLNSRNEGLRYRGYRAWDRSYDGGESFIESGFDPTLVEPHCAASVARYSGAGDGRRNRILFSNPAVKSDTVGWFDGPARRNLTVRLSYDECRTWPVARTVYERPAGYSGLAVAMDGTILCHFERARDDSGRSSAEGLSSVARFNLEWLTNGEDAADA